MKVIYLKLRHEQRSSNSLSKLKSKVTLLHSLNIHLKDSLKLYDCEWKGM